MTAETAFELYNQYVTDLHEALSKPPAGPVAEAYRVKRLSRSEFELAWQRWGAIPGLQERWVAQFSAGCQAHAKSMLRKDAA